MHAPKQPAYAGRYQRNKRRLGKQRRAKVAQIDIARRLTHAIRHMPTRNHRFAPRAAAVRLAARPPALELRPRAKHPNLA